jgi:hypothetical protein
MDGLERESKKGNPLIIDLTNQEEEGASSDNSSVSSRHDSDDSDYNEGDDGIKQRQKKKAGRNKLKTQDKGDSSRNENDDLTMLSKVCGDVIGGKSEYTDEEISVNKDNCGNNNLLDDLFNADKDKRNREQEEDQDSRDAYKIFDKQDNTSIDQDSADGVETGKKKKKQKKQSPDEEENNSEELSDNEITEQSRQSPREGDQVDTITSKGTIRRDIADQERQESTQLDSPKELSKSQKKRFWKREKKAEKRKREQSEDQESGVPTDRFDEEDDTSIKEDSADGVEKIRKKKKKEEVIRWYLR